MQNQLNIGNVYEGNGIFTFNGEYSGSGPKGGSTIGDQNLDFLMGTLGSSTPFQQSKKQQNALRGPIPKPLRAGHLSRHPQLDAGRRPALGPNIMPRRLFQSRRCLQHGRLPGQHSQLASIPTRPRALFTTATQGVTRQFTKNSYWQFSPNVGVSFDPVGNGKTVIRAGGALMYDNPNFFTGAAQPAEPALRHGRDQHADVVVGARSASALRGLTGAFTTSPFPQPAVPTPSQALFFAQSQYIVTVPQFKPAYTIQWTLSVQHEFGHGWQAQLDYIGNTTRHDPMGYTFDPAVFIPGVWGAGGTGCTGIVTTGPAAVKPGAAGTNCSTTGNQSFAIPAHPANPTQGNQYEGSGGGSVIVGDEATANYNGLVASINHRLSSTFSLLANWTWSKCLNI